MQSSPSAQGRGLAGQRSPRRKTDGERLGNSSTSLLELVWGREFERKALIMRTLHCCLCKDHYGLQNGGKRKNHSCRIVRMIQTVRRRNIYWRDDVHLYEWATLESECEIIVTKIIKICKLQLFQAPRPIRNMGSDYDLDLTRRQRKLNKISRVG